MKVREAAKYSATIIGVSGLAAIGVSYADIHYDILSGISPLYSEENGLAFKSILRDLRQTLSHPDQEFENMNLQQKITVFGPAVGLLYLMFGGNFIKSLASIPLTLSALAGIETYEIMTNPEISWYENASAAVFYSGGSATMAGVGLTSLLKENKSPIEIAKETIQKGKGFLDKVRKK